MRRFEGERYVPFGPILYRVAYQPLARLSPQRTEHEPLRPTCPELRKAFIQLRAREQQVQHAPAASRDGEHVLTVQRAERAQLGGAGFIAGGKQNRIARPRDRIERQRKHSR